MTIILWIGFLFLILFLLFLDLGVFNKRDHVIKTKEALLWTMFWIFLSLLFNVFIYFAYENHLFGIGKELGHFMSGEEAALKYFTGYVIEKSLSLDNIFVIVMIFSYFHIPTIYQHRVLFWGIVGALLMRGAMIFAGVALIEKFEWMIFVFGGLLIVTALKMLFSKEEKVEPNKNILVRFVKKFYRVSDHYDGHKFFTKINGATATTPLFIALVVIESSDVLFAIDSIPAIFAVTTDPFIVFTSNVFAILGLRALYFALAAMIEKFVYLKISIVFVLIYVGIKMILSHSYPIPTGFSLGVILLILLLGITASLIKGNTKKN
jgi:tellurite resistance protein TerC